MQGTTYMTTSGPAPHTKSRTLRIPMVDLINTADEPDRLVADRVAEAKKQIEDDLWGFGPEVGRQVSWSSLQFREQDHIVITITGHV